MFVIFCKFLVFTAFCFSMLVGYALYKGDRNILDLRSVFSYTRDYSTTQKSGVNKGMREHKGGQQSNKAENKR